MLKTQYDCMFYPFKIELPDLYINFHFSALGNCQFMFMLCIKCSNQLVHVSNREGEVCQSVSCKKPSQVPNDRADRTEQLPCSTKKGRFVTVYYFIYHVGLLDSLGILSKSYNTCTCIRTVQCSNNFLKQNNRMKNSSI